MGSARGACRQRGDRGRAVRLAVGGLGLCPIEQVDVVQGRSERLMLVNVFLVAFNMLPAFPMDGGRVVRALLATRMEYTKATQVATALGQGMAFLFGLLGLLSGNPMLIFIALFVWVGATQEASVVQIRSALGGIPVSRAMIAEFHSLAPDDPLSLAVDYLLRARDRTFRSWSMGRSWECWRCATCRWPSANVGSLASSAT